MCDVADALLVLAVGFNSQLHVERTTETDEKYSFQVKFQNLCLNYKVNEF
jgi:hypothetical protein